MKSKIIAGIIGTAVAALAVYVGPESASAAGRFTTNLGRF